MALLLASALFWPRFSITAPSLVDDWFSLTYAPTAWDAITHGHYDAAAVDYGGRYRPAYAVLNYVQWSLTGSKTATAIPTMIGLLRLLLFMAAVGALTAIFVERRTTRAWTLVAASTVPLLCVATPGMTYNFVRFGVAETTAVAALAMSLLAIAAATRRLVIGVSGRRRLAALALLGIGYAVYLFGVYLWEASVAVVFLLPSLYIWLARSPDVRTHRLWSRRPVLVVGALLLLPLVHVLSEVMPAWAGSEAGGSSPGGLLGGVLDPLAGTVRGSLTGLMTPVWAVLFLPILAGCVYRARRGDRYAALCLGMLAFGSISAYISNLGAPGLSRYYTAWLVAVAISGAYLISGARSRTRLLVLYAVILATALGRPDQKVTSWLLSDRVGSDAITLASRAYSTGCPLYAADFPGERRVGLARLLRPAEPLGLNCGPGSHRAFLILWTPRSPVRPVGCAGHWQPFAELRYTRVLVCADFDGGSGIPTQDIDMDAPVRVVRLVKPSGFVPASSLHSFT